MFAARVQGLTQHLTGEWLSDPTRKVLDSALALFDEVDRMLEVIGYSEDRFGVSFSTLGDKLLQSLRDAVATRSDDAILRWVQSTLSSISGHVSSLNELQEVRDAESRGIATRTATVTQQASALLDQAALRASAEQLNEELRDTVDKAKDAVGDVGNASLAGHFASYADKEVESANRFRLAALIGFGLALSFALIFGNGKDGWFLAFQNDWTALAFKVAGAVGIGGISAYLARQGGQHRRMANWARSMAVQLQSFPAFVEPLAYEEQAEMYRMLARRVLTAPPEKSGSASEDSVGMAQLLDLATNLAKRSGANTPASP